MSGPDAPEMSPERSKSLRAALEKKDDWHAFCPNCQKTITGRPSELREHNQTCGASDDDG